MHTHTHAARPHSQHVCVTAHGCACPCRWAARAGRPAHTCALRTFEPQSDPRGVARRLLGKSARFPQNVAILPEQGLLPGSGWMPGRGPARLRSPARRESPFQPSSLPGRGPPPQAWGSRGEDGHCLFCGTFGHCCGCTPAHRNPCSHYRFYFKNMRIYKYIHISLSVFV